MSTGDSVKITVFGRGAHGSMPHLSVGPVVLPAAIVLRLQTIVSRETGPGEFAVVTVGASNAGTPKEPTFEYFGQFPLTDTSEAVNDTITEALTEFFGTEAAQEATPATASDRGLSYEIFPCGSGIRSRS